MKILWVKSDFLHPTTKGGHIRTLEMLKRLRRRHEIHYVAFDLEEQAGAVERSGDYSAKAYPIPHKVPRRFTPGFWAQAAAGIFASLPLAVSRYRSTSMRREITRLAGSEKFDTVVCDFLFPAINFSDLSHVVLFQHNVESAIWKRHAEHGPTAAHRAYFRAQYQRMRRYETDICRAAKKVIAVSQDDAEVMGREYGVREISWVPTGVDIEFFSPPGHIQHDLDLVFVGSMDWMPNDDGVVWFLANVLPLIRTKRPDCSLAIVGRRPSASLRKLAKDDPRIVVTGTVTDVRPYLWRSKVSIVPLRIGGGTRLKIYEAMGAQVPVVSTTIGAEGLDVRDGENIALADSPREFADRCLALLDDADARRRLSSAAWEMVSSCYSWDVVSRKFEQLLA